jgi:hypothetical protein
MIYDLRLTIDDCLVECLPIQLVYCRMAYCMLSPEIYQCRNHKPNVKSSIVNRK